MKLAQKLGSPNVAVAIVALTVVVSDVGPGRASDDQNKARLIEQGRLLFMNETFGGNGRTCATCHPPTNNFTLDPAFIETLAGR